ncbi:hypothetical protein MHL40_05310 [Pseudomonas luteola]|uniref:hypothetical protein n=1 Tax=Pseudomonas luteola TaxID=47886 RepID=UPI001EF658FA|nr:hypothetical protein [Pseudomonas luteola]MCG7372084.1 hypothetical protein [Pseudomonas luteola]
MGLNVFQCHIEGCQTAVLLEGDVDATFTGSTIKDCTQGFVVREHADLIRQLGLPEETDPKALAQALQELVTTPVQERESKVKISGWGERLFGIAKGAPDYTLKLLQIANDPKVQQVISSLSSQ